MAAFFFFFFYTTAECAGAVHSLAWLVHTDLYPSLPLHCHMDTTPLGSAKGHLKQGGKLTAFAEQ